MRANTDCVCGFDSGVNRSTEQQQSQSQRDRSLERDSNYNFTLRFHKKGGNRTTHHSNSIQVPDVGDTWSLEVRYGIAMGRKSIYSAQ